MIFLETSIPDVIIVEPKIFGDSRGFFAELYRAELFAENGISETFVQDNISRSVKNTIRGLHYQKVKPQAKLVMVSRGAVLDVAVDLRRGSATFGKHVTTMLTEANRRMMFIPKGFAHGFAVLSDEADFQYKCSDYYAPEHERTIRWDDKDLFIDWKVEQPLISEKDAKAPLLKEISPDDLPDFEGY